MQLGLTELCKPVQGNFMETPFPDGTFDAAYAIEATCHADKVGAQSVCLRSLVWRIVEVGELIIMSSMACVLCGPIG